MYLSDLEVLVCLAEEGNFSRAAERLNRTQPAVSQAIRRIEEAFQVKLLDRTSRRTVMTGAGASLVSSALRMLQIWGGAKRGMNEFQNGKHGVLRLVGNGFLCEYLLPPLLESFRRDHPSTKIEVILCPATGIPSALLDQDFDFGFLSFAPSHSDLETRVLLRDDLVLAVPPQHPLAKFDPVTFLQLSKESFLAHSSRAFSRKRLEYQLGQEGVQLRVVMELPNLETIKRFVAAGAGITILPRLCLERELAEGFLVSPRLEGTPIGQDLRVVFRRSRTPSPVAEAFLAILGQKFQLRPPGKPDQG